MKIIFILGPWFLSIFCHWKKSVLYFFVVFKSLFNLFLETQIPLSWWAFKFNLSKLGRFILWQAFLPPSQIYAYPLRHHLRIFSSSLSLKHPDLKLNTKPMRSTSCTKSFKNASKTPIICVLFPSAPFALERVFRSCTKRGCFCNWKL